MVRRQEGRRAKVAGTCVIADGKFQPSAIMGVTLPRDFSRLGDTWRRRLSCFERGLDWSNCHGIITDEAEHLLEDKIDNHHSLAESEGEEER
jgi:hypothetical protein